MIDHRDFEHLEFCIFWPGGYSADYLEQQFDFAPSWLPADYRDFFLKYYHCGIMGIEIVPPAPVNVSENAAAELNDNFHDYYPELVNFYAIVLSLMKIVI
ncbi:hypothetical protein [Corynebacterium cystitidis]|uniref:hypothetical protein n=1 Tax=Corynebacterium cystitidis TaxID=35757 RepID=UPI00211E5D40|nr:hypothetical protein [Corynebacterium cystitidis]